ncbi:hypothetical protein Tco_0894985 [Tanacetum coccineum]|uniref:Uncharacterized protein n=1 Tax=Tanacetum coccineum TaxID=301880 RepID=A0ABQ5CGJ3_9ASTR
MPDTPYSRGSIRRIKLPGVGSMLESSGIFADWLPRMADSLFWMQRIGLRSCYIECRPSRDEYSIISLAGIHISTTKAKE